MPYLGESLVGDLFDMGPGGKGTNLAVAARRLGADVRLIARVGDDMLADMAFALYAAEGIDARHVVRSAGAQTAAGLVYLQHSGEHTIGVYCGANWLLAPADIAAAEDEIACARVLATQLEILDPAVAAAVALGRRHGLTVLLNPAPARPLPPDILGAVDVLTPNEGEARLLVGLRPDDRSVGMAEIGHRLLEAGPRAVIITLGARGCLVIRPGAELIALPAYPVTAVDAVGAGDAFGGALAVALAEGRPLVDAARWANIAAGLSTQTIGAIPGLPRREVVDARASEE
jgi:ribokinase